MFVSTVDAPLLGAALSLCCGHDSDGDRVPVLAALTAGNGWQMGIAWLIISVEEPGLG